MFHTLVPDGRYRLAPLSLFVLVAACSVVQPQKKVVVEETRVQAADSQTWSTGMRAFHGGRYREALQIFENLHNTAEDTETRRRTLYALSSIQLLLAQNDEQFQSALERWEKWQRQTPGPMGHEDPRMLWPLLLRLEERQGACEKRLKVKEREVQRLEEQIEALEAIHQHIERKKKGVSIP